MEEIKNVGTELANNTGKALKSVTTGQLVAGGIGCAAGGAAVGIGSYIGIRALWKKHKEKKAAKKDSKKEEKSEEKKPTEDKKEE